MFKIFDPSFIQSLHDEIHRQLSVKDGVSTRETVARALFIDAEAEEIENIKMAISVATNMGMLPAFRTAKKAGFKFADYRTKKEQIIDAAKAWNHFDTTLAAAKSAKPADSKSVDSKSAIKPVVPAPAVKRSSKPESVSDQKPDTVKSETIKSETVKSDFKSEKKDIPVVTLKVTANAKGGFDAVPTDKINSLTGKPRIRKPAK